MGRFATSVSLAKESLAVLRQDKELAAIPVASAVTCSVIALAFGGGAYLSLDTVPDPTAGQDGLQATPLTYVVGVAGLLVIGIAAQCFAAVLVAGANERLEGGNPTLASAARRTAPHVPALIGWAAMNVTVGLVLSAIRERVGVLGDLATRVVGAAWDVVTWLAVPVIVIEGTGPITGVKRSASLLRATWGENIIAQAGIGLVGIVVIVPGIVVFGALTAALPVVGLPLLVLWIAVTVTVLSALTGIFRAALYRYAVGLPSSGAFPEEALAGAFGARGNRRR